MHFFEYLGANGNLYIFHRTVERLLQKDLSGLEINAKFSFDNNSDFVGSFIVLKKISVAAIMSESRYIPG